ncbi:hypothetical protein Poli38472_010465 [Pythium oligandrum]|uniref:TIR domain-containing protein n=1 Tax=Pythium oligandrum TaxID=41045 RepID=A0A8K1C3A5_PYTOL|nr:hypothetical protein Poli38472_010465 [Pythium oligandrum]|eukprot:TMW55583.1 hypothetical protein Poli38472_010465 [Pythium oligandrum]
MPSPRNAAESALNMELSHSRDEFRTEERGNARPSVHFGNVYGRDEYVAVESPRNVDTTAARVVELVTRLSGSPSTTQFSHPPSSTEEGADESSTAASTSLLPRSSGSNQRSDRVLLRATSRFRSLRRLYSTASHHTDGSALSTTSHEHEADTALEIDDHESSSARKQPHIQMGNDVTTACPSSHYYIDPQGRLQARKTWWLYTRLRRLAAHLVPGFKRDSNSYLCAPMITNTGFILSTYLLRLVLNQAVLASLLTDQQEDKCHDFSSEFLDTFSFTLAGNVLLCLPAFHFNMCKLFQRVPTAKQQLRNKLRAHANGSSTVVDPPVLDNPVVGTGATAAAADGAIVHDDNHPKLRKTYLFSICEVLVIFEIPYLIYTFVTIVFPTASIFHSGRDTDVVTVSVRCGRDLPFGLFLLFLIAQLVGLIAYGLRWKQIILFHRMHEHFLYQRGCVPGRARFDYIEQSFRTSWFASARSKQIHQIKAKLYHAAKYGEIDELKRQLDAAIELDGTDFAQHWYEPRPPRLLSLVPFLSSTRFMQCQRNPLHVAVAFDHAECVQELLSQGLFDIHQGEKMEVLKLNISWLYRFFFDIVPILRKSNYARHESRLIFGPVGLFTSTLLTPLHVATSMGNTDMVLLLLRYGANPNYVAQSSHRKFATPVLFWAINKECARLILDADANPLYVPGNGYCLTAFEVARLIGNHVVAREMEKYGGDVALTPLHDASARGFKEEVEFYLEHGADPNTLGEKVTGFFRRTPLHWAAIRGKTKTLKLLLKYGATIDARDAFGRTALTWACLLNRTKAVEVLLKFGADVNVRDNIGDPLLCICAAGTCSSPSTGAFTSDGEGRAAGDNGEHTGSGHGHSHGPGSSADSSSSRALDPEIFALLQDYGIDLHTTREFNGDTALHVALRKCNEATSMLFVRAGMSLTAVNYLGQRAMDCTMSPSLRYLIKKEAGHRDVMISYCHSHSALARKVRDALENAQVTTWIDSMDPSGITGGSVWRKEIAHGIRSSALVLALLTRDYPVSQWCMKELAFAKMHNVPIVAIQCEDMEISEELQVYLWTRQVVDFRRAFVERILESRNEDLEEDEARKPTHAGTASEDQDEELLLLQQQDPRDLAEAQGEGDSDATALALPQVVVKHEYDEDVFRNCMRLLLDGIQDQIEEYRVRRLVRERKHEQMGHKHAELVDDIDEDEEDGEANKGGLCGVPGRTFRRTHSMTPSEALRGPNSPSGSVAGRSPYVFIAHGDYHLNFCTRLKSALQKQGIRCVVDHSVPAIQYNAESRGGGSGASKTPSASYGANQHHSNESLSSPSRLRRINSTMSTGENATTSVQARQLAAKDAILDCAAVIIVLSPLSASCDMLADQLAFAEDRGKLIVPLLLSLQNIDLAKRYTFSRSIVQHFNISIGFEQSLDRLALYLHQSTEATARQQQQHQLEEHKQHRRRRRRRQGHSSQNDIGALGEEEYSDDDGRSSAASSPASSVRSGVSRVSLVIGGPHSPSSLPPPLPIIHPSRQPPGSTSGHGWSIGTPTISPSDHHPHQTHSPRQHHHFTLEPLLRSQSLVSSPSHSRENATWSA